MWNKNKMTLIFDIAMIFILFYFFFIFYFLWNKHTHKGEGNEF